MATALAGATLAMAPMAHADRTLTATQACQEINPGTKPISYGIFNNEVTCVVPSQGTPPGAETLRAEMARVFPGSYQQNPADPWSAWVIPG